MHQCAVLLLCSVHILQIGTELISYHVAGSVMIIH